MQAHTVWLPLSQVALTFPSPIVPGEFLTTEAVKKWHTRGVELPEGRGVVKLQAKKIVGHWYTTQAWLDAFLAAVEAGHREEAAPATPAPVKASPSPWGFTHEVAARYLNAAGV